jgi:hypothetical protein
MLQKERKKMNRNLKTILVRALATISVGGLFASSSLVPAFGTGFVGINSPRAKVSEHLGGGGKYIFISSSGADSIFPYSNFTKICWEENFFGKCTKTADNKATSIFVSYGCLKVWEHINYEGRSLLFRPGSYGDLRIYGFDNIASSMKWYPPNQCPSQ